MHTQELKSSIEHYKNQTVDMKELIDKLIDSKDRKSSAEKLFLKVWKEKIKKSSNSNFTPQLLLQELHKQYYDFRELVKNSDDIEFRRLRNDQYRSIGFWGDIRGLLENTLPKDFGIVFSGMDLINLRVGENENIKLDDFKRNMISFREDSKDEIEKVFSSGFFDEYLTKVKESNKSLNK